MPFDFSDLGPTEASATKEGIDFSDLGPETLPPDVQARKNVAEKAKANPRMGVPSKGSGLLKGEDWLASALFSAGRSIGNIPHGVANLLLQASENFDPTPGLRMKDSLETPEQLDEASKGRELQAQIRSGLTEPINEPFVKTSGYGIPKLLGLTKGELQPGDLTDPESPLMKEPGWGAAGELAPDVAMALEGVLRVPSVAGKVGSGIEKVNDLGASILESTGNRISSAGNKISNSRLAQALSLENKPSVQSANQKLANSIAGKEDFTANMAAKEEVAKSKAIIAEEEIIKNEAAKSKVAGEENVRNINETLARKQESDEAAKLLESTKSELEPRIKSTEERLQKASALPEEVSGSLTPESEFGKSVSNPIRGAYDGEKSIGKGLYNDVRNSLPAKQPEMELVNIKEVARIEKPKAEAGVDGIPKNVEVPQSISKLLKNKEAVNPLTGVTEVKKVLNPKNGKMEPVPQKYKWDDMEAAHSDLTDAINRAEARGENTTARYYIQIKKALKKDMDLYADKAGLETKELFDEANAHHAQTQERFGKRHIQEILETEDPSKVVDKLIKDKNPVAIKDVLDLVTPEAATQIKRRYAQRMFSPKHGEVFNADHFVKEFGESSKHETLRNVFGDEKFAQMEELYKAAQGKAEIPGLQKQIDELDKAFKKSNSEYIKAKTAAQEFDAKQISEEAIREFKKAMTPAQQVEGLKLTNLEKQAIARQQAELDRAIEDARKGVASAKNTEAWKRVGKVVGPIVLTSAGYNFLKTF